MSETTNFGAARLDPQDAGTEQAVAALIARVGERVRSARESKGIPRRVLSDRSGVSPRYLAQLEAGEGNISIGLLQRVALALDCRIEWFLGEEEPAVSEGHRVADLFRTAPADVQEAVLRTLSHRSGEDARDRRICLVGLRGAGKSTLGKLAGAALDLPFVELNREIEAQSGMAVDEVLALYGHEGYRRLEAEAMDRVTALHDTVIMAVAGGIVSEPDTYRRLLARFHTIWLRTSPGEHMARVRAQGDERPMAGNPEAMEQLKSILTSRQEQYEMAEAQLDTSGRSVETSLADLLDLIRSQGFLG